MIRDYLFWCPLAIVLLMLAMGSRAANAEEPADHKAEKVAQRWVLIACGLPGDEEHRERLTNACRQMVAGAQATLGAQSDRIRLLAGDETMQQALSAEVENVGICTKESMAAAIKELGTSAKGSDGCWVFLLGHAHLSGRESQFNVSGPDFHQGEFAQWAKTINCREQVFWLTMPISGFWIKPLSGDSRVIISATEADLEFTGTEMPYALAQVLAGKGEFYSLEDVDRDKSLTLLDLYLTVNREIDASFKTLSQLQTEHAQLEDNGDGRGSEVQTPYLPIQEETAEESDEEPTAEGEIEESEPPAETLKRNPFGVFPDVSRTLESNMDGYRSQQILIKQPI
ncbi:hypothetical protein GC197_00200 [bacterium]|nr:hypothetical protein [bacterium]